jgi:hypothetical protein
MRLNGAFERKLSQRPERLELAFGVERLSDTELAAAALERAEDALGVGPVARGARGP